MKKQHEFVFPEILDAFIGADLSNHKVITDDEASLPSWYQVTDLAVESMAVAGFTLQQRVGHHRAIEVSPRLASMWFDLSIRPVGWELPPAWDSIAGNYQTNAGWVRLHTNAPLHKQAALQVLGCIDDRKLVSEAVKHWSAIELAESVVKAGGCATAMFSPEQWQAHPQGKSVSSEPLIHWDLHHYDDETVANNTQKFDTQRPLEGIKVLDLTRILAGPVATRFLAAYGADVLRIDPPNWDEASLAPEVTVGKRCASLDLRNPSDKSVFERLLKQADLLIHGYRSDALAALGYGASVLREINPRLVDVSLCAYGWTGPWATRRGFDSVVQMSCGIASYGMAQAGSESPVSLPVQALDHATGYLIAAAAIHALNCRDNSGAIYSARLSLARTGSLLMTQTSNPSEAHFSKETLQDLDSVLEKTEWGDAQRIRWPLDIEGMQVYWSSAACGLHTAEPRWSR